LGKTPQLEQSESGQNYTNLSIATNHLSRANEGERQTDWFWVRVWGKQAENCTRYLQKGQGVMVEGYLNTYLSEKSDGRSETRVGINALKVEFLPKSTPAQ